MMGKRKLAHAWYNTHFFSGSLPFRNPRLRHALEILSKVELINSKYEFVSLQVFFGNHTCHQIEKMFFCCLVILC